MSRTLTRSRVALAFGAAILADVAQLVLGPLGWLWADEVIDVAATMIVSVAIGFHPLLLPTFIIELVPVVDVLPTWTACVAAVVALRRHAARSRPSDIDVRPTNVK